MQENPSVMYARAADRIYIGNTGAVEDLNFLSNADISAVINLSRKKCPSIEDVDVFEFLFEARELMDMEFPKIKNKLSDIAGTISDLRNQGRSTLIYCEDGRNKCALAVGYFLISTGSPYTSVIGDLEMLYLTPGQRKDELDERARMNDPDSQIRMLAEMDDQRAKTFLAEKLARKSLLCLTINSFKKLLRLHGGAKK